MVSTDDFEGMCESLDTLPQDSRPLYGSGNSETQTGKETGAVLYKVWGGEVGGA